MFIYRLRTYFTYSIVLAFLLFCGFPVFAQFTPPGGAPGAPVTDTSMNKSNTDEWDETDARIFYKYRQSDKIYYPDSSIHTFHRRPFSQPWQRDLGNLGTPSRNLMFTPEYRVGPSLGYHAFDVYRYDADSMRYYNTSRPYSYFNFGLGSKLEQAAEIMHTQNIRPNWNFSFQYRKINSPGFYQVQRANNDNANVTTYYQSPNLHYELYGAFVYNKEQQDENGCIVADSFLLDSNYNERRTIPINYTSLRTNTSVPRSAVINSLRDYAVSLQHGYTFGRIDTLYNEDSTRFSLQLTPRFGLSHKFEFSSSKHRYKDLAPDSLRYLDFFTQSFAQSDSVYSEQRWNKLENNVMLNSFLGKKEHLLHFGVGLGNRLDRFQSKYILDSPGTDIISNYFIGQLKKEALLPGQWFYQANTMVYFTGDAAGSSVLQASFGKDIKNVGSILLGFSQQVNIAPYNYTTYYNQYDTILSTFSKGSVTELYATVESEPAHLAAGVKTYLVGNYMYLNQAQLPVQYTSSFNVTELWLRKIFKWRTLVFDNELAYQQRTAGAPVNVPLLLGRHQLSIEKHLFHSALQMATGVEVSYHSPYNPSGYSPYFNRFYYQNTYQVSNSPVTSVFFNFKVKKLRVYIMGDQVQQLFARNFIVSRGYAAQNFMIRFGFKWILIN